MSSIYVGSLHQKVVEYNFRIKTLCEPPPHRSQRFSKGSLLWNSLSDEMVTAQSLTIFKQKSNPGMRQVIDILILFFPHIFPCKK